jgi:hypothetical protein
MPILFNKTVPQCRLLGARGGRASARNRRLRKLRASPVPPAAPLPQPEPETAHQASLLLDCQFPWLEEAFAPRQPPSRIATGAGHRFSNSPSI